MCENTSFTNSRRRTGRLAVARGAKLPVSRGAPLLPVLHDVDPTGRPDPRRARTSPIGASRIRPEALPYREPPKRVEPLYFPPISSGIPVRNRHGRSFIRARNHAAAGSARLGSALSGRHETVSDQPPTIIARNFSFYLLLRRVFKDN